MNNIRNFAIIAHVDHGKSTLADRFLELTGITKPGEHEEQLLDRNPISRERGITIKLAPVRMEYSIEKNKILNSELCILNLIDTPGHIDFSYEVDRTLACVEGVILLIDAAQGIQAQTVANARKAIEKNLIIIPAINKIDLPNADTASTKKQLINYLNIKEEEIFLISAKTGEGVIKLLEAVIDKIPPPTTTDSIRNLPSGNFFHSLIFDSYYDIHRGVIAFVRIFNGQVKPGLVLELCSTKTAFTVTGVGIFAPDLKPKEWLNSGEIGYIVTNLKNIHQVRVGDTIINKNNPLPPLPGYKKVKSMVFASIFTTDSNDYLNLKKALEKLYLNDSSLNYSQIYSRTLGAGFRVGFLGILHADVVRERLEREFGLDLVLTPPQIEYITPTNNNFGHDRDESGKDKFLEPIVKIIIVSPKKYLGTVMQLCQNYRCQFITMDNFISGQSLLGEDRQQTTLVYEMPMSELISDFYDNLKSISSGYASLDWQFIAYRPVEADKLTLLLNNCEVEEFSEIVVRERAEMKGHLLVKKLRQLIPRQQYEVKIQAKYKGKIIASERIAPFRKDVTKKLYGGDRTRKDKLLEQQKEGKKRMKMIGKVEIPKEAFFELFKK